MVLFLNTLITPVSAGRSMGYNSFPSNNRLGNIGEYDRSGNPQEDKLDILKYMIASYSLIPWDKAILQIELDGDYQDREPELKEWVTKCFKGQNYEYTSQRCTNILAWRSRLDEVLAPYDERYPVWFACNHDHIFIAPNLDLVNKIDELFLTSEDDYNTLFYSHWSEFLRHAAMCGWKEEIDGFISYNPFDCAVHSMQIVSKSLLLRWFETPVDPNAYMPRTDWCPGVKSPPFRIFMPKQEIGCHFDGYSHLKIYDQFLLLPKDPSPSFHCPFTKEEVNNRILVGFQAFDNQPNCPEEFLKWAKEKE